MSKETLSMVKAERDRCRESAIHALTHLIFDAQDKLKKLMEHGRVETTVGGSALNHQLFMDAERSLVLFWRYAGVAAWLETERAEHVGLSLAPQGHLDLIIVNMQDDGWLCADAGGMLWWYPEPHFYVNLTLGHDDPDDPGMVEPGQNIRVKRADVTRMDGSEVHEVLN
jgi:hypothetical protein